MSSRPRLTDEQIHRVVNTMIGTDMSLGIALTMCGFFLDRLHNADVARCADRVKRCTRCRQWAARAEVVENLCPVCWEELYPEENN